MKIDIHIINYVSNFNIEDYIDVPCGAPVATRTEGRHAGPPAPRGIALHRGPGQRWPTALRKGGTPGPIFYIYIYIQRERERERDRERKRKRKRKRET